MLSAEQILDAVSSATGVPETFKGYPLGTRAIELAEGGINHPFLQAFSKPVRDVSCECAREDDPSLPEMLHLLNNAGVLKKVSSPQSHLATETARREGHGHPGGGRLPRHAEPSADEGGDGDRDAAPPCPGRSGKGFAGLAVRTDEYRRVPVAALTRVRPIRKHDGLRNKAQPVNARTMTPEGS